MTDCGSNKVHPMFLNHHLRGLTAYLLWASEKLLPALQKASGKLTPLSPAEGRAGTVNTKDITPTLIDAQIESSCSQLTHLEKQSAAFRQMEVGDKQTDIYNFL